MAPLVSLPARLGASRSEAEGDVVLAVSGLHVALRGSDLVGLGKQVLVGHLELGRGSSGIIAQRNGLTQVLHRNLLGVGLVDPSCGLSGLRFFHGTGRSLAGAGGQDLHTNAEIFNDTRDAVGR